MVYSNYVKECLLPWGCPSPKRAKVVSSCRKEKRRSFLQTAALKKYLSFFQRNRKKSYIHLRFSSISLAMRSVRICLTGAGER